MVPAATAAPIEIRVNRRRTVMVLLLLCAVAAPMNISLTLSVWLNRANPLLRLGGTLLSLVLVATLLLIPILYRTSAYTIEVDAATKTIRKRFAHGRPGLVLNLAEQGRLWISHHGGGIGSYRLKAADARHQLLLFSSHSGEQVIAMGERIARAMGIPLTMKG
ncbi:MAG: hypothetical protein ACOY8P_07570 [Thermodesulfobacteriota bacterium]